MVTPITNGDLMSSTELVIENLQKTAADYRNPEVQVADLREKLLKYFHSCCKV